MTNNARRPIRVCDLGVSPHAEVWQLQKVLFQARVEGTISDVLLLTEHSHVYTIGKTGTEAHLLVPRSELKEEHVDIYEIDRGGDITYHGPGQLVAYPILDLKNFYLDIHRYLRDLEQAIILTLNYYGINAGREPRFTGVWVEDKKIAAIGVKVSRWVTMHGLAVNVNSDLSYFDRIVPCGISQRGVTSVERILGTKVSMGEFRTQFVAAFEEVFRVVAIQTARESLREFLPYSHTGKELCLR
jgi:lipoyl(octanoyl) transferase